MIPKPSASLTDLAVRLATHIAPGLQDNFSQADAGLLTGLFLTFAQDFERSVGSQMEDITDMQAIFSAAGASPMAAECERMSAAKPESYYLDDVTACHAECSELLIQVHAWAESHDDSFNLQIWRYLRAHSERHKFELPNL